VTAAIGSAREQVRTDPEAAESELEEAEGRLRGLARVYLPLYGAKVEAANAYRHHALGDLGASRAELDRVDEAIAAVSRETGGGLEA
ncbi:MAG: hypothetical protein GWN32_13065, partial [Gemmatimonadetes bacterium]|nr:hypothetical protein [Gemmatimonadota bacterium]